jgi:hypothetical protein
MDGTQKCQLSFVFAREAPVAVILRRGPTLWVEVIRWNTSDDVFERGQWLHGRIYAERCGLSPDGSLFVYFARAARRVDTAGGYKYTFTAVSKPPYLTALAMWPGGSTWGVGGRFVDDRTLRLAYGANGTNHPGVGFATIFMAPMPPPHPKHPPIGLRIETDLDYYAADLGFRLNEPEAAQWRGRDHSGREVVAREGRLLSVGEGAEIVLADFASDCFRDVPVPEWARTW